MEAIKVEECNYQFLVILSEQQLANAPGTQGHEEKLGNEANGRTNGSFEHLYDNTVYLQSFKMKPTRLTDLPHHGQFNVHAHHEHGHHHEQGEDGVDKLQLGLVSANDQSDCVEKKKVCWNAKARLESQEEAVLSWCHDGLESDLEAKLIGRANLPINITQVLLLV